MIQFSKLRLHGFKSFVDKTELEITPGLTGIVGPNGCGKSNLVEALKWSMGESSSKKMRGGSGSMDDVIFNGTATRPARKNAEVSVLLDNSSRQGPPHYNDYDEIEVVRKIERDHGSAYKINGKSVRARDVNLLYADILSGSNSPFLVSQGKVTTMIQSKPHERRLILEEAAGISGLYARRHEAELRLRATETNLRRLDDILASMQNRLYSLKKQSRQAARYRNLGSQIRQLEVMINAIEYMNAYESLEEIERKFSNADKEVAEHLTVVTQLTKTQNAQSVDLPELRENNAKLAAKVQNYKLLLQRLEDEDQSIEKNIEELSNQIEQAKRDKTHEKQNINEFEHILSKLESEERNLVENENLEDKSLENIQLQKDNLSEELKVLDDTYNQLMQKTAQSRARRQSLSEQIEYETARVQQLKDRISTLEHDLNNKKSIKTDSKVSLLKNDISKLEELTDNKKDSLSALDKKSEDLQLEIEQLETVLKDKENYKTKIKSEIQTLESVLNMYSKGGYKTVLDDISTDKGFEKAISKAMGDSLMASLDKNASMVWSETKKNYEVSSIPGGLDTLLSHVKAPKEVHVALSQIGLVESYEQGQKFSNELMPGQSLVSKDGSYWRWDGLHIKPEANEAIAVQLKQKNKLKDLTKQLPEAEKEYQKYNENYINVKSKLEDIKISKHTLSKDLQEIEAKVKTHQLDLNKLIESESENKSSIAKLEEGLLLAGKDIKELEHSIDKNKDELNQYNESISKKEQLEIETSKNQLEKKREEQQGAIRDYELKKQEHRRAKARLRAIGDERINLQNRHIRANERIKELEERITNLSNRKEELHVRPKQIKQEQQLLLDKLTISEKNKAETSDKLAQREIDLSDTTKALKEAEIKLSNAREIRAHSQATAEERKKRLSQIKTQINESFEMSPQDLLANAAVNEENRPDLEVLRNEKEKATKARDSIGPVNLRAEEEANELDTELTQILNERNDLLEAINELRQGINKLNKEARDRLEIAFEKVNAHFRHMFGQLFTGGKAHLELIDSDDPLEAGLEIYAQPPGKSLQSLTLLSGGEQTLTALALIFAMFLTNPSPICVLDEVDAPLDDANVDKFCDVLEEFADKGETRFLIITHHRMTMARMDRLYGVTMSERGVSQLVSVDLHEQLSLLDEAA
jgi:chromosome segregation protein